MLDLLPSALRLLLAATILPSPPIHVTPIPEPAPLHFYLRHEHALSNFSRNVFRDVPNTSFMSSHPLTMSAAPVTVHRPTSHASFQAARARWRPGADIGTLDWGEGEVQAPNVSSRTTLQTLAKMTNNAYSEPGNTEWYDLGEDWDVGYPFGWEPDMDGFRGHVFVSEDNATVVISIKGTSAGWLVGGSGPTVKKDRLNDNLLFSCCCARVGPTWTTVCGCYSGGHRCDQDCVEQSLIDDSLFYSVGVNLYNNITYMYPEANIWLTGHSLGGSLASLIGATFGAPTVAFEAPGEKLASTRLHLPSPPSTDHIVHVYHTADPIAMGVCNGVTSTCAIGGYAMETRCHLGRIIRYDTVSTLGWAVDIRTHGIRNIVERLLGEPWPANNTIPGGEVPEWFVEEDCVDCFDWEYGSFKGKRAVLGELHPGTCS